MSARRRARTMAVRDQRASTFSAVLLRLCDAVGAKGAALVDAEGETVDYAGAIDPFDIKVAAAEWCVVLALLRESKMPGFPETEELALRGGKKSFSVHVLSDGYALVLQLLPHAFAVSRRALHEAVRELCTEAGLDVPRGLRRESERWRRVDVRCEPPDVRRPRAVWVSGAWCALEVLGRWADDLGRGDVGYRARLPSGAELTLVRERLGRWYVDIEIAR
jgi:hypothetical protein